MLLAAASLALPAWSAETPAHWPQWRGPEGNGVAPASNPPVKWGEETNVRWKVEIPGKGNASPVIWGEKIFLTTAVPTGEAPPPPAEPEAEDGQRWRRGITADRPQRFVVMALDRATGKTLWEHTAREAQPHEGTHLDGTWASASPVTDGEVLVAHFGSHGIYAYDLDGKLLWSKDLGDMRTRNAFGEGASPALHGDTVVINWDHEEESFIVALDKKTGKELWRQPRPEEPTSWSTPVVLTPGGKPQVIVSATGAVRGYDLASGDVIWQAGGLTLNVIPTPVHRDGTVYVMSGFRGNALFAIDLSKAKGDVTGTEAVRWSYDRDTPYVPSPLLYGDLLYFLKSNRGILSILDAETGEVHVGPARLEGIEGVYASPVGAAGRVYVVGRNGVTLVLNHGKELEVLATNTLNDTFDASPALAEDEIYLRGASHLYKIKAAPEPEKKAKAEAAAAEAAR